VSSLVQAINRAALGDSCHEVVCVVGTDRLGHCRLFLQGQTLFGRPGETLELDPYVEERRVRGGQADESCSSTKRWAASAQCNA